MGVAYEAQQISLDRNIELKVVSAGLGMTTKAVIHFRCEAETAAKLHYAKYRTSPRYPRGGRDALLRDGARGWTIA